MDGQLRINPGEVGVERKELGVSAALVSLSLALSPSFAEDKMGKGDAMKKEDTMSKDAMKKDDGMMKKDGTIVIKGKDITIDGSGKINAKAGGDIKMKGSKIHQN